jgi:hypothetical protein
MTMGMRLISDVKGLLSKDDKKHKEEDKRPIRSGWRWAGKCIFKQRRQKA